MTKLKEKRMLKASEGALRDKSAFLRTYRGDENYERIKRSY